MAHSLKIIYGGSTVDMNGGTIRMMEQYVPRCGDGNYAYDGVQFEISGTAVSVINEAVASMTKAMKQAVRYNGDRVGDRVYLSFQPDGYTSAYQSELVPASDNEWKIEWDSDTMSAGRWSNGKTIQGYLTWKRRDYWQGAKTTLSISNSNGTATTGINVYNCNDGDGSSPNKRNNYFDVDGADIVGADLPCPVYLKCEYNGASNSNVGNIYIGANTYGKTHVSKDLLPGSSSAGTASATASGGTAIYGDFATYGIVEAFMPSSGDVNDIVTNYGSQSVGFLLRFDVFPPSDTYIETIAYVNKGDKVFMSDKGILATDTQLQLVAATCFPLSAASTSAYLKFKASRAGGTIYFDTATCIPMGNYIRFDVNDLIIVNEYFTYDSSLEGSPKAFLQTNDAGNLATYGSGIYLLPGEDTRFLLCWENTGGTCTISDYLKISASYYPRRRTL